MRRPERGRILAVGAVALVATLASLVLLRNGRGSLADDAIDAASPEGTGAPTAERAPGPLVAGDGGPERAPEPQRREQPVAVKEAAETGKETAPDPELDCVLKGTVTEVGENGAHLPLAEGTLHLFYPRQDGSNASKELEAPITDGRFEADVPCGRPLMLGHVAVGDRIAEVIEPQDVPADLVASGTPVEVRVTLGLGIVLHVRDAATGLDLSGIELQRTQGWPSSEQDHPGPGNAGTDYAQDATSPIDLRAEDVGLREPGKVSARVHVAGYAWKRVTLDFLTGGDQFVELAEGGDVALHVTGVAAPPDAFLQYGPPGRNIRDSEVWPLPSADSMRLEDLPTGPATFRVGLGKWWAPGSVLGETRVTIVAGKTAEATIELQPPDTVTRVDVPAVVRLPSAWELDSVQLQVDARHSAADGKQDSASLTVPLERNGTGDLLEGSFELEQLAPGRYGVSLLPIHWCTEIDIRSDGARTVTLEVPPPAAVELVVRDATSHAVLRPQSLGISCGTSIGSDLQLAPTDDGTYRFRAPLGQVRIFVRGGDGRFVVEQRTVAHDPEDLEVELGAKAGVRIRILDGTRQVPLPQGWFLRFEALTGDGSANTFSYEGKDMIVFFTKPGRYRFDLPAMDGYLPVPTQQIEVQAGSVIDDVIELVRKP